uniref:hypothetical protein n=1 Tax=Clostridium estertheticum TaxID=238834 RepID=UPI00209B9922|nr:hypothetical protein [Clostridium estertheticum]
MHVRKEQKFKCFLFGELIDGILDETENKVINIKEHKRPIRTKGDREELIKACHMR